MAKKKKQQPPGLTKKQKEVLAFIEKHGRATVTHVAYHFKCSDPVRGG